MEHAGAKRAHQTPEELLLNEIQLLLAEKRTYLSLLRTGLAVFGAPLSIVVFLLATTNFHGIFENHLIGGVIIGTLIFISLVGLWIFFGADRKLTRINRLIYRIKNENKRVAEIIV
jgi:uncharacterized membrane protein YidH (DUF202 family)